MYKLGTFKLGAGKSVTIHTGKGSDDRNNLYWGSGNYIWNNDGDKATLRSGHIVDTCSYSGGGQAVSADEASRLAPDAVVVSVEAMRIGR